MEMNGIHYGIPVAGTRLIRHGDAPRRSATDRNQMAWYECANCGAFKMIRVQSVKPGTTISCGCVGRKQFIIHHEQRAANLPQATQNAIFKLARHPNKKKRKGVYFLAKMFKVSTYIIDFVVAARCASLRALKGAGETALRGLNWVSRKWAEKSIRWANFDLAGERMKADRDAYLAALPHWRDRDAYLAAEAAKAAEDAQIRAAAPMTDELWAAVLTGEASVEFVEEFTPVAFTLVLALTGSTDDRFVSGGIANCG